MAALAPGELLGGAPEASYALYRTESGSYEGKLEEFYWLFAAERADSLGADILNSSVGYNIFADDPNENYLVEQLDGDTPFITRAADLAAATGMLVVNSAGNDGNISWRKIIPPADADSILSVGGVDFDGNRASFSSYGPSADGRLKPEVSGPAVGIIVANTNNNFRRVNGTSFAAPLITALAAGIWQQQPELTAMELRELIIRSGSQFNQPDTLLGHGVPSFIRAANVLSRQLFSAGLQAYPNPVRAGQWLHLPQTTAATVRLINTSGSQMYELKLQLTTNGTKAQLPPALAPGIYFIQVGQKQQRILVL